MCSNPVLECESTQQTSCIDLSACDPDDEENKTTPDREDILNELRELEKKCFPGGELDAQAQTLSELINSTINTDENAYLTIIKPRIDSILKSQLEEEENERKTNLEIKEKAEKEEKEEKFRTLKGIDIYTSACNYQSAINLLYSNGERKRNWKS
jgi:hypothetical protein